MNLAVPIEMNDEGDDQTFLRYTRSFRRDIRAVVDPFRILDSVFMKNFRLTKDLTRLLVRELSPFLSPDANPLAVPNTIKILSVLNFYASGAYQAQIDCSWLNCLGRSTVGHFIQEVTEALNNPQFHRRWIQFPHTLQERQQLAERHQQAFEIPGVVGFIEGTEVTISTPPENFNPQSFWTRKHQYAINYAFIYKYSAARRRMREAFEEHQSCWHLGDSGYPSEPWLLVPILNAPDDSAEVYFTMRHCKARNCVERCIGVLKGRFRCLLRERALHYAPDKAGKIVKACCLLHNLCRKAGVPEIDMDIDAEEEPRAWVPQEHEAMDVEDLDPELIIAEEDANLLQVGRIVRRRVVEFLDIQRRGLL